MGGERRSRSRYLRRIARGVGFDLFTHMSGGGGGPPVRVWPVGVATPLRSRSFSIPTTFEVEIEKCTSFVGFSYRSEGWNPHVESVRELIANPELEFEDSTLARLYERYQPRTLQDVFVEDATQPLEPLASLPATRILFRYVWALSPSRIRSVPSTSRPQGHHYFGPQDPEGARKQFDRLRTVYMSIQTHGFQPERFGAIMGYFLTDGVDHRFIVGSGNHRIAVLKALGHTKVVASLNNNHPAEIQESKLSTWSTDEGGPFSPGTAEALFVKQFTEDGKAKARRLGLLPA